MIARVTATDVARCPKDNTPRRSDAGDDLRLPAGFRPARADAAGQRQGRLAAPGQPLPRSARAGGDRSRDRSPRNSSEIAMDGHGLAGDADSSRSGIFGFNPEIPEVKAESAIARDSCWREAGYPNGFKFTLSFTVDRLPGDREIGTTLAQMLARIGVEVQANGVPVSSCSPRGRAAISRPPWRAGARSRARPIIPCPRSRIPTMRPRARPVQLARLCQSRGRRRSTAAGSELDNAEAPRVCSARRARCSRRIARRCR